MSSDMSTNMPSGMSHSTETGYVSKIQQLEKDLSIATRKYEKGKEIKERAIDDDARYLRVCLKDRKRAEEAEARAEEAERRAEESENYKVMFQNQLDCNNKLCQHNQKLEADVEQLGARDVELQQNLVTGEELRNDLSVSNQLLTNENENVRREIDQLMITVEHLRHERMTIRKLMDSEQ